MPMPSSPRPPVSEPDPRPVLSLDLDGTLVHGALGGILADVDHHVETVFALPGLHAALLDRFRVVAAEDPVAAYDWQDLLDAHLAEHGVGLHVDLAEVLGTRAPTHVHVIHPDTVEHLRSIAAAGWRVVILTNGRAEFQIPTLRAVGLFDLVDEVITAEGVGAVKPHAAMFEAARGAATVHVHAGDLLVDDVLGARRSGAHAVLLRPDVPAGDQDSGDQDARERYLTARAHAEDLAEVPVPDALAHDFEELTAYLATVGPAAEARP
jgi:FMN phosphatase YigB (HAD superfamily)